MTDSDRRRGLVVGVNGEIDDPLNPRFIFAHPNETSKHIARHGIFEKPLIQWCKNFCSPNRDFIDIGAHAGTYALSLAPYCRKVHAFEPQKMTFYALCGGIALNHLTNVVPHNVALGQMASRRTLHISTEDGGGSTLHEGYMRKQGLSEIATESCAVLALDNLEFFEKVGFIKIDVEGAELEVLLGAARTIVESDYPPILFECWPDDWFAFKKRELMEHLSEIGYAVRAIDGTTNMFLATR